MVQTNKQSAGNILNMHNPDNLQSGPSSAQPPLHSSVTKAEEDTEFPFAQVQHTYNSRLSFILDDILEFEHQVYQWSNRDDDEHTIEQSKRIKQIQDNFVKIEGFIKKIKKMANETKIFIRQAHDKEHEISISLK